MDERKKRRVDDRGRGDDGVTGTGGSDLERRAASMLSKELEATGRSVQTQEVKVRAGQGPTVALHAAIALAGSLLGLALPIAGAAIVLLASFSFYAERGLGLFLASRLLPRRRTRNLISPPIGPAWENEVSAILVAGYDAPPAYPAGRWLNRLADGRLTTDRLLFWVGMVPTFAVLMMRVAGIEGTLVQLIQILTAAILLAVIAAQVDRRLQGEPLGVETDLAAARDLIAVVAELENGDEDSDGGIGICLFGAESDGAAGAEAFYLDRRLKVRPGVAVIGLVAAASGSQPQATGREGDLTGVKMDRSLIADSPLKPEPVTIRRDTAAGRARRRGARAITLVASGEAGVELVFDALDAGITEGSGR